MEHKLSADDKVNANGLRKQNRVEFIYNLFMAVMIVGLGSALMIAAAVAIITPLLIMFVGVFH